ncbi:MAG: Cas8a1 family CRISPR/Cas system-associated protein [Anaerotignum sp.]
MNIWRISQKEKKYSCPICRIILFCVPVKGMRIGLWKKLSRNMKSVF